MALPLNVALGVGKGRNDGVLRIFYRINERR